MSELLGLFGYWAGINEPACFNTNLGLLLGQSQIILKQLESLIVKKKKIVFWKSLTGLFLTKIKEKLTCPLRWGGPSWGCIWTWFKVAKFLRVSYRKEIGHLVNLYTNGLEIRLDCKGHHIFSGRGMPYPNKSSTTHACRHLKWALFVQI